MKSRSALGLIAAATLSAKVWAADWPGPWTELASDGTLSVRIAVAAGTACPKATADGIDLPVVPRASADDGFPVVLCEARAPAATRQLTVGGSAAPSLPPVVRRIVVIGDTGCRLEGRAVQECSDPEAWPFAEIARRAANQKPDLVIHVGDYYYRETACPADRKGCAGSPHGDNWETWQADFFEPAAPLLAAAPWVMVRGNHELCRRGGRGWFHLLDPHPAPLECRDRSDPFRLHIGGVDLLWFDGADADDFSAPAAKVALYAAQLAGLLAAAPPHAWLLIHRPIWALAQGDLAGANVNATEQAAISGQVPPGLDLVVSGHLHDFASYKFGPDRPAQLLVGDSGDTMLELGKAPLIGATIDGMQVRDAFALKRFGYFVLQAAADGWDGSLYGSDDAVLADCQLRGRSLECGPGQAQ
ncbi:MAG: metallophosphoesterase [Alphaproteobacteria bacterium]|nr:metallophosphoesterase [Alphaproteobacteria bacterium]